MKKGLIITLPRHDPVTEYLAQSSKVIIEESENNNVPCKQLKDEEVTKENFEKLIKNMGYKTSCFKWTWNYKGNLWL